MIRAGPLVTTRSVLLRPGAALTVMPALLLHLITYTIQHPSLDPQTQLMTTYLLSSPDVPLSQSPPARPKLVLALPPTLTLIHTTLPLPILPRLIPTSDLHPDLQLIILLQRTLPSTSTSTPLNPLPFPRQCRLFDLAGQMRAPKTTSPHLASYQGWEGRRERRCSLFGIIYRTVGKSSLFLLISVHLL
jgi:hypothetical protein